MKGKKGKLKNRKQETAVSQNISQAEDKALKLSAQYFGHEMLGIFNVKGNIREVFATELNYVEFKRLFQDFNYLMEDGSCSHFEFESDRISTDDLRRFRAYEAVTSYTYNKPVTTHVICSANVKNPLSHLKEGINEYHVNMIRLRDGDADEVFRRIEEKRAEDVTKADLLEVVLTPLMSGEMSMKDRISKGFKLLEKEDSQVSSEERNKMQAVLYLFALKFLTQKEVKELEGLHMTYFAKMMQDEGRTEGRKEGRKEGKLITLISQVVKKMNKGKNLNAIAEELEEEPDIIRKICDLVNAHGNESVEKLMELYQKAA